MILITMKTKKIVMIILLSVILCLGLIPTTVFADNPEYNGGTGTLTYPYLISIVADLQTLANTIDNGNAKKLMHMLIVLVIILLETIMAIISSKLTILTCQAFKAGIRLSVLVEGTYILQSINSRYLRCKNNNSQNTCS